MSPVEPSGRGHVGRAALVSLVAIILVFAGLWLISITVGKRNSPDLRLGDQTFRAGNAEARAAEIERNGPILFSDVSGRQDRDLILQHLGDDPDEGWHAIAAQPIDRARDCFWDWQPEEEIFRATCDPSLTAPADGEGSTRYHVTIDDGAIEVDLNFEERSRYERERSEDPDAEDGSSGPDEDTGDSGD